MNCRVKINQSVQNKLDSLSISNIKTDYGCYRVISNAPLEQWFSNWGPQTPRRPRREAQVSCKGGGLRLSTCYQLFLSMALKIHGTPKIKSSILLDATNTDVKKCSFLKLRFIIVCGFQKEKTTVKLLDYDKTRQLSQKPVNQKVKTDRYILKTHLTYTQQCKIHRSTNHYYIFFFCKTFYM